MLAQKVQRICWSGWINSLDRIQRSFHFSLVLHPFAPIQDRQIVMRGEIVGINGLQRLELRHGVIGTMLLIVGNSKLTASVAAIGILRNYFFKIGDLGVGVAGTALNESHVVQRPCIIRLQCERLLERLAGLIVFFPFDVGEPDD